LALARSRASAVRDLAKPQPGIIRKARREHLVQLHPAPWPRIAINGDPQANPRPQKGWVPAVAWQSFAIRSSAVAGNAAPSAG